MSEATEGNGKGAGAYQCYICKFIMDGGTQITEPRDTTMVLSSETN